MRPLSMLAVAGAVVAVVAIGGLAQAAVAGTAPSPQSTQSDAPDEANGGSIVEDGSYPNAAQIEQEQNIVLISGDGHIVLADCSTPRQNNVGVMRVWTTDQIGPDNQGLVCFKVLAPTGILNLRVPAVFEIDGDGNPAVPGVGHKATAEVTTDDGTQTSVTVDPNGATPVGIGADPSNEPTTLLQLKVTG